MAVVEEKAAQDADVDEDDRAPFEVARLAAFVDAVVAIAMTLLILPLMESVSEVASSGDDTAEWFAEHDGQLTSFLVSFVIIAMFWTIHHRLFTKVEKVTQGLLWLTMLWLLTIVWLPVATAISGQMSDEDELAKIVYIGSMIATSVCSLLIRFYLATHASLHGLAPRQLRAGIAADLAMTVLFGVALTVTLLLPQLGYWPMFVMALTGPLQYLFARASLRRGNTLAE